MRNIGKSSGARPGLPVWQRLEWGKPIQPFPALANRTMTFYGGVSRRAFNSNGLNTTAKPKNAAAQATLRLATCRLAPVGRKITLNRSGELSPML